MSKFLVIVSVSFFFCISIEAKDPTDWARCESCLSKCPHKTKDIKACDKGCPKVCSKNMLGKILLREKGKLIKCKQKRSDNGRSFLRPEDKALDEVDK